MENKICKDDKQFVDYVHEAYVNGNEIAGKKVHAALSAFLAKPMIECTKKIQALKKSIQAVSVSTDFDQLITNAFNFTIQEDNFDLGYERVFRSVPLDPYRDFWEIYNVTKGLWFRKVEEGNRIPVEGLEGEVATVYVDYYGGALGWTDKMMRYRKIAPMIDMAMIFRNSFYINKANNHYLLLAVAAAGNVTAYQGLLADGELRRDIQTINRGAYDLSNRNKDKGYGDTANARFVLFANPLDKARINAAMRATTNSTLGAGNGTVGQEVSWNIEVIYTYNANIDARHPILVFPYWKIQRADAMQPTTYTQPKDPLTLNSLQAVWAIYGAAVGDTDQCQQIDLV